RVGAAAHSVAAGGRRVEDHPDRHRRVLPRVHDRRRRPASRKSAARRGRSHLRVTWLVTLSYGTTTGRRAVGRLGAAARTRAGLVVPGGCRTARSLNGPWLDAERLAANGTRRP